MPTYKCVVCGTIENKFSPTKRKYLCRQCKILRDEANKRARSKGTWGLKTKILKRRGKICEICNTKPNALIMHHKVPVSQGGKTIEKNVQLVCDPCHRIIHNQMPRLAGEGHAILGGNND